MTNKFEQLIEFVINDDEQKARALFHDIVVEKSREIYENLMNEEESEDRTDETIGGDAADDLIDDVEVEEEGMYEEESDAEFDDEAEEAGDEETADIEADHDEDAEEGDIEDRVVDLEDKLDELMAEFEAMMGDDEGEEVDAEFDMEPVDGEVGGDAFADDDTAEFVDAEEEMMENVSLKAAPKPVTAEPAGTGKNSPNANNSGSRGAMAVPVKMTGDSAQGRPAPKAGDLIGKVQNTPGGDGSKQSAAPKPVTAQAAGVNSKTPFPKV